MRWICLFIFFCLAIPASAQRMSGRVMDEHARPVAEASVRLLNTGYHSLSDSAGAFHFYDLPQGSYLMEVKAGGYSGQLIQIRADGRNSEVEIKLARASRVLEPVVISSGKTEASLLRMPVTVRALTAPAVEAYRLWQISDLSAFASNLHAAHPGDNRNVSSIRGIVNTSYDQAVATYVDGVNQFNLDTYIPQLFDVERIEVLKGPQGSLYGRNAMGGVIHIITKKPGNRTEAFGQITAGTNRFRRYTAGIRLPLLKDRLFMGAAGLFERTEGFYFNEFNKLPYDKKSGFVGNYYLRYVPAPQWQFTINAKHAHNRNRGAFPLVFGAAEAMANPYRLNQNAVTRMVDDALNASLSAHHFGRSVQLSSQTAYQSNYRFYTHPIDADFSPLDAISIVNNYGRDWNRVKVWTQEFNLRPAAAGTGPLQWLAGLYLFHLDNPVKQTTRFGEHATLLGAPDHHFSLTHSTQTKGKGAAVYGEFTYSISSRLALTGGLRYDREQKDQQVFGEYKKDGGPAFPFRTDTAATIRFSAWSPRLALAFYPNDQQTLYLSYGRGFRAGGLTPLSSDPSQPALHPFKPEYRDHFEAGWKYGYAQTWFMQLVLFHAMVREVQLPTLVMPDAVTVTRNTGRMVTRGVEAEWRAVIGKLFQLDYQFGYTHAEYRRLKIARNGNETELQGKRQLFTPEITSMLALQYQQAIGKERKFLLAGLEWKYTGTQYFDLANTIRQSGYHLLHARLGIRIQEVELSGWGRNITGRRYISYAYDFGAVHLGAPAQWGLSIGTKF